MPESRRIYRVQSLTVEQINQVLSQMSNRLDELEGFRGEPNIRNNMTINGNLTVTGTITGASEQTEAAGNINFDVANCDFSGESPYLEWTLVSGINVAGCEIRWDTNFGTKDVNLIAYLKKELKFEWKDYVNWTTKRGLTENQKRNPTIYVNTHLENGSYGDASDSITLNNAAPTMAAITPTITKLKHGKILRLLWATYTQPSDLAKQAFKIFASTVSPVSIADDTYFVDWVSRGNDHYDFSGERGVTYYFRIEPWDVFGKGTAS